MSQSLVPARIPGAQGQYPGQQLYPKTPGSPMVQTHAAQAVEQALGVITGDIYMYRYLCVCAFP